jgi:hypothetical protein
MAGADPIELLNPRQVAALGGVHEREQIIGDATARRQDHGLAQGRIALENIGDSSEACGIGHAGSAKLVHSPRVQYSLLHSIQNRQMSMNAERPSPARMMAFGVSCESVATSSCPQLGRGSGDGSAVRRRGDGGGAHQVAGTVVQQNAAGGQLSGGPG